MRPERPTYIASCSFGKDSIATILLALENNEPLDKGLLFKDTQGLYWCDKFKNKVIKKMLKL